MNKVELELIHRELDGENSPEESSRLHAFLAENSEAGRLYDELSTIDLHLRDAKMVEPPLWLKRNIMDSLPAEGRSRKFSLPAIFRELSAAMQARPALAYAYTFALGIVFGLGIFAIALQDSQPREGELYGALANQNAADMEDLPIQLPGFRGSAEVSTSGRYIIVDLIAEADEKVDVRFVPESSLMLGGFARKADNADTSIEIDDDEIVLGIQGFDKFAVMFNVDESNDPSIRMEIRQAGRLIYEEQLEL